MKFWKNKSLSKFLVLFYNISGSPASAVSEVTSRVFSDQDLSCISSIRSYLCIMSNKKTLRSVCLLRNHALISGWHVRKNYCRSRTDVNNNLESFIADSSIINKLELLQLSQDFLGDLPARLNWVSFHPLKLTDLSFPDFWRFCCAITL